LRFINSETENEFKESFINLSKVQAVQNFISFYKLFVLETTEKVSELI